MNVGIIGFGLMGKQRADDINKLEVFDLKSVYDKDFKNVAEYNKTNGFKIAKNPNEIINDSEIELIILSVPHFLIKDFALKILHNNKHLLCEKPLGRKIDEANEIIKSMHGALLEPGFNYRYYDGIKKIKELITDKKIGNVHSMRCVLGHGGRPGMEKEWKLDKELCGGGALLDPGIHIIDLSRFLFGEIQSGFLSQQNGFWDTNVEDNVFVILEASGTKISLNISLTEWKSLFRMEIFGDEGAIYFSGRSKSYGPQKVRLIKRWFWDNNVKDEFWEFPNIENSFQNELEDFFHVIKGEKSNIMASPQDGFRAIEIIETLYNSPNQLIPL
jgi:predicted dehydrogenase